MGCLPGPAQAFYQSIGGKKEKEKSSVFQILLIHTLKARDGIKNMMCCCMLRDWNGTYVDLRLYKKIYLLIAKINTVMSVL